jgi:branched-subunit amino acid transport protein
MNINFLGLLDLYATFGNIFIITIAVLLIRSLIIKIRKREIRPPVQQFLNWLLMVMAGAVLFSTLLAAGGGWLANWLGNPSSTMMLVGGLLGGVIGGAVGWEFQRRTIL